MAGYTVNKKNDISEIFLAKHSTAKHFQHMTRQAVAPDRCCKWHGCGWDLPHTRRTAWTVTRGNAATQ
jgi:hypothetical protein